MVVYIAWQAKRHVAFLMPSLALVDTAIIGCSLNYAWVDTRGTKDIDHSVCAVSLYLVSHCDLRVSYVVVAAFLLRYYDIWTIISVT